MRLIGIRNLLRLWSRLCILDFKQLYPHEYDFVKFTRSDSVLPGLYKFMESYKIGNLNKNFYKGSKIILVNELTQSHAEFMTMMYKCSPNTIVIGSQTAGADGDIISVYLPGGILTSFTGLGVYYPDGRETQKTGIIPDITITPTIQSIRENRDLVLEKAIELLK